MEAQPLVSIIMPSLNQVEFIEQAIDSVLNQPYKKVELIISDGGSNDRTIELLIKKQAMDSRIKWTSEKDTGPANALNKALLSTKGTIIGWLNSDDLYQVDTIQQSVQYFKEHPSKLMLYGEGEHIDEQGQFINNYPTHPPTTTIQQFRQGCFICQPTVFFKRTMTVLLGQFDERLKTAFDFDYWLKAFSAFPERIGYINQVRASSRLHQNCITQRMRRTVTVESMKVLSKYIGVAFANTQWILTYIDELIEQKQKMESVLSEFDSIVDDASPYIVEQELTIFSSIVKQRINQIE